MTPDAATHPATAAPAAPAFSDRALDAVVMRYSIEPVLAGRLAAPRADAPCGDGDQPELVVRLAPSCSDVRHAMMTVSLSSGPHEIELRRAAVHIAVTHGPRLTHLDARRQQSTGGTGDAAGPAERDALLVMLSIETVSGRVIFARSAIADLLGLPGGTYDPPRVTVQW